MTPEQLIVLWNAITVPIAVVGAMLTHISHWTLAMRLGFVVAVLGQLAEVILIVTGVDRVSGWGNFWFLKDLGIGLIGIALLAGARRRAKGIPD